MAENPKQASPAEEYNYLRLEMINLATGVRTLWGTLLGAFVAAAGVLFVVISNIGRTPGDLERVLHGAWLLWASVILSAIPVIAVCIGYLWYRHMFYIGSYLIVAHERAGSNGLQWLTLNRKRSDPDLQAAAKSVRTSYGISAVALFVLSLFPGLYSLLQPSPSGMPWTDLPFSAAFVVLVVLMVVFIVYSWRFRNLNKERDRFTDAWARVINPNQSHQTREGV